MSKLITNEFEVIALINLILVIAIFLHALYQGFSGKYIPRVYCIIYGFVYYILSVSETAMLYMNMDSKFLSTASSLCLSCLIYSILSRSSFKNNKRRNNKNGEI